MARRKSSNASEKKESSKGLGDTIEKITEATGIKAAVDWFSEKTGVDCGCDKRKEKLNNLFRYTAKVNCLEKDEYDFLSTIIDKSIIRKHEQDRMNAIYNRVFSDNVQSTNCGSCLKTRIQKLKAVHSAYEKA